MQIADWINLFLAVVTSIGVILALFFGIRSIRESRNLQIVGHKIDLLEKISNWVANAQNLYSDVNIIEDLYSYKQTTSGSVTPNLAITRTIARIDRAWVRVLEEGRNMYGIAVLFSPDLSDATKSLETSLQTGYETLVKNSKLIESATDDNKLEEVVDKLDKELSDNLKSLNESIVKIIGVIFTTRLQNFDSILLGTDPFKNAFKK